MHPRRSRLADQLGVEEGVAQDTTEPPLPITTEVALLGDLRTV